MKAREEATIAVFCSGSGSNFQALIEAEKKGKLGGRIAVMVCDNPKAYALTRASKANIPSVLLSPKLFKTRQEYEHLIISILKTQKVRLVVLAGFMRIFTEVFIKAFKGRILNIHPSYLPAFKGAHAIRDAYEARVKSTGVTVHLVTLAVDAGQILVQKKVQLSPKETLATLQKKIHAVEHKLYPQAIKTFLKK